MRAEPSRDTTAAEARALDAGEQEASQALGHVAAGVRPPGDAAPSGLPDPKDMVTLHETFQRLDAAVEDATR